MSEIIRMKTTCSLEYRWYIREPIAQIVDYWRRHDWWRHTVEYLEMLFKFYLVTKEAKVFFLKTRGADWNNGAGAMFQCPHLSSLPGNYPGLSYKWNFTKTNIGTETSVGGNIASNTATNIWVFPGNHSTIFPPHLLRIILQFLLLPPHLSFSLHSFYHTS